MALRREGVGTEPPLGYGRGVRPEKNPDGGGSPPYPLVDHSRRFAMRSTRRERVLIFRTVPFLSRSGTFSFERPMPSG
jgi:hypothetical protein